MKRQTMALKQRPSANENFPDAVLNKNGQADPS